MLSIQVVVFWLMTQCSVVVGYQRFGGPCCLHLQGECVTFRILVLIATVAINLKAKKKIIKFIR
jgi:hypothetical protein